MSNTSRLWILAALQVCIRLPTLKRASMWCRRCEKMAARRAARPDNRRLRGTWSFRRRCRSFASCCCSRCFCGWVARLSGGRWCRLSKGAKRCRRDFDRSLAGCSGRRLKGIKGGLEVWWCYRTHLLGFHYLKISSIIGLKFVYKWWHKCCLSWQYVKKTLIKYPLMLKYSDKFDIVNFILNISSLKGFD